MTSQRVINDCEERLPGGGGEELQNRRAKTSFHSLINETSRLIRRFGEFSAFSLCRERVSSSPQSTSYSPTAM
jgi:hypothetical protein